MNKIAVILFNQHRINLYYSNERGGGGEGGGGVLGGRAMLVDKTENIE